MMTTGNLTVALAGNPNCGKTTIFNNMTGARQHVGNYPGVTVEKREGFCRFQNQDFLIVDLPGTYSLTAHSMDELVARNVIINEKPDIIVNVLDAANLERNLYLAVQLLELERPLVLGLNMADMAEKMGIKINEKVLADKLDIPVVRMVGNRNQGTEALLQTIMKLAATKKENKFQVNYGELIEEKIQKMLQLINDFTDVKYPFRWLAIKLLEDDKDVKMALQELKGGLVVMKFAGEMRNELAEALGEEVEIAIAAKRYQFVGEIYKSLAVHENTSLQTASDKIDSILTHRLLGLPIFFATMWLMFNIVFTVGAYPQDWLAAGVSRLGETVALYMPKGDLQLLLKDGIIGGVGAVITFLPNILLLFLGIALLEDSGYMARAAFVMDRIMRAVGLHGKSFIPLLMGFGCNVPAIMGTRTLENPHDRMVTILVSPLMSCSARLPVYTVLIGAFFAESMAGTVLFTVYFTGILLAVLMALVFRKLLFPGESEAFVMEMPAYHWPTLRSIVTHMWERSVLYLKKAGTLILAASIIVWFLTNYPTEVNYSKNYEQLQSIAASQMQNEEEKANYLSTLANEKAGEKLAGSYAGQIGKFVEPVIKPLGFDWKIGVGLISAVAAKEVLISTLGTIYSVGSNEDDASGLEGALATDPAFSPLVAFALMLFTLIYSPCLAALAVIRRETNSWAWTVFAFTYSTALAYCVTLIIYQAGIYLGY